MNMVHVYNHQLSKQIPIQYFKYSYIELGTQL